MNANTSFVPTINSTTETCHLLTPLELFYWSLEQIAIQGRPAVDGNYTYYYRIQYEGQLLKCPAGHCIPDDVYDASMEGTALDADVGPGYTLLKGYFKARFSADQCKAIKCAQLVHDTTSLITVTEIATTRSTTMGHITAFVNANKTGYSFSSALADFLKD